MSQIMLQIPYTSSHSEALQRGIRQGCSLGPYLFIVLSAFTSGLTSEAYVSAGLLLNGDCHPKYEALAPPPPILNAQYFGSFITPTASIPSVFVAHKLYSFAQDPEIPQSPYCRVNQNHLVPMTSFHFLTLALYFLCPFPHQIQIFVKILGHVLRQPQGREFPICFNPSFSLTTTSSPFRGVDPMPMARIRSFLKPPSKLDNIKICLHRNSGPRRNVHFDILYMFLL